MKKVIKLVLTLTTIILLVACNKDDNPVPPESVVIETPDSENQAPNSFLLLAPEVDGVILDRTPIFSWEQATDPDGDPVTYDLYLDTQENPSTLIAENLNTTSYELTEKLDFETQYYWKVIAKDGFGGSTGTMTQELFVDIPMKWLSYYENPNGPLVFEYTADRLIKFGPLFTDLEGSPSKLVELRKMDENFEYEYSYTATGKQNEVFVNENGGDFRWLFVYDQTDRISSITQEYTFYNGETSQTVTKESVFEYNTDTDLRPKKIRITNGGEIYRYTLLWEGNNIVELLEQHGEYEGLVKISYDDNINPYYGIFTKQFGFDSFFVLTSTPTEFESIYFDFFSWQSFNNIISYEVFNSPAGTEVIRGYSKSYSYNDSYYPTSAMVELKGMSSTSYLETWVYQGL